MENNKDLTINNDITYGRGYVYSLQYHLVWCTKYRKKVLRDGIDTECREMLTALAEEYKFCITAMEVMPDHIHLLVDCRPQFYIPGHDKDHEGKSGEMAVHEASGAEEGTLGRSPVESLLLRCDCK